MRKRFLMSLGMMFLVCTLTGCKNEIPDLSDEDMKMVEEYAASLLLKYDKNYSNAILSEEDVQKEMDALEARAIIKQQVQANKEALAQAKIEEEAKKNEEENADTNELQAAEPVYANISEFLSLDNIEINFSQYIICDSYPIETSENDWQGMARAANGNSLVAFEFNVINNNSEDYYLDMASLGLKANVKLDNTITKSPLTTLLLNDFMMYRDTVMANSSAELVLLIELSQEDAQNFTSAVLTLKYNGNKMETSLL